MGGYSEEELLDLMENHSRKIARIPYWTSEVYGIGEGIREYGFYPNWLPLYIYTDHGVARSGIVGRNELENDAEAVFFHSIKDLKEFKKLSKKPAYCYCSPLAFYRKNHDIQQDKNAKGTLAFPVHGIHGTTVDIDQYIQQLKTLDKEFQPVSVCLHRDEIKSGVYRKFYDAGIDVYTAGDPNDIDYAKRFYETLSKFKYATSNQEGSYLFYAVEMGIPFFIYGEEVFFKDYVNDKNEFIERHSVCEFDEAKKVYNMFYGIRTEITPEQREYVEKRLGIHNCISRKKMARILYLSYLKRGFLIRDLLRWYKQTRKNKKGKK